MATNYKIKGQGFTLIEILIAIAIIGILAAGVIIFLNPFEQFKRTRDTQRKSDLNQLQSALSLYYADNGNYPDVTGAGGDQIDWGSSSTPYIQTVPKDPTSARKYCYQPQPDGTYKLFAKLENSFDPQIITGLSCASDTSYNYCISPSGPC